jgi:hypothetical protein
VQTLGGFNVQEAEAYAEYVRVTRGEDEANALPPYRALPVRALDHAAGHLLAFGIAAALCKTVTVRFFTPHLPFEAECCVCTGRRLVAGARLAQRDVALDTPFWKYSPSNCVWRWLTAPTALRTP